MRELDFTPNEWPSGVQDQVLQWYLIDGIASTTIQDTIGITSASIRRMLKRFGVDTSRYGGDRGQAYRYYEITGQELPEEFKPRLRAVRPDYSPQQLKIVDPKIKKIESADEVSLHWSDTHFPFHDPRAISCLYQIASEVKPTTLVMQGDLIDLWQISTHRPPLETKLKMNQIDIQESINQAVNHLGIMSTMVRPGADKIYLMGNHEDRFERTLADMQLNPKTLALMRIPKIQETLNLDYILGLSDTGWDSHNYLEGDRFLLHDRLLCIHGYRANMYSAKAHLQDYGKSVIFGHSHRIQNWTSRDLRGTDAAWNMGCLCELDPHWRSRPNWHQGFAVVVWKKVDDDWFYSVEQVRVHEGVAIFRDKIYRG
jgi:predicted phosphodiesterase